MRALHLYALGRPRTRRRPPGPLRRLRRRRRRRRQRHRRRPAAEDTFAGGKEISSGRIDASVDVKAEGNVAMKLSGPFQSTGDGKLPKLDLQASFEGEGESVSGGLTSTGDQGFVGWGGTQYAIAGPVFQQFKAGFEESAKQAGGQQDQSLASLGIDPRRWLTNARNAGEAEGRRHRHDQDHRRRRRAEAARRRQRRARADPLARRAGRRPAARPADRGRAQAGHGRHQGPQRRDPHRRRRPHPAPDADRDERAGPRRQPRPPTCGWTSSCSTSTRTRTSRPPRTPSRSRSSCRSCSRWGSAISAAWARSAAPRAAAAARARARPNVEKYSQCIQDAQGDNAAIRKCADLLTTP